MVFSCVARLQARGGMCACSGHTHMPPVRVTGSRTYCCYRPSFGAGGAKPDQVRAHLPPLFGFSHALPLGSCRFRPSEARTSPGFLPAGGKAGRNPVHMREQMAGKGRKCAALAHVLRVSASLLAGKGCKCASTTHVLRVSASVLAENGHRCASSTHLPLVSATDRDGKGHKYAPAGLVGRICGRLRMTACSGLVEDGASGRKMPAVTSILTDLS